MRENFPDSRWKTRVCKPAFSLHRGTKLVFFVPQNRNAVVLFRNSSEFLRGISGKEKFGWVIEPVFYKSRVTISVRASRKFEFFFIQFFCFSLVLFFSRKISYGGHFFDRFVRTALFMSLWTSWVIKNEWKKVTIVGRILSEYSIWFSARNLHLVVQNILQRLPRNFMRRSFLRNTLT